MRPLAEYACLVFDCDGVILASNALKTEAFRSAASPYGEALAQRLVEYHVAHGGISRHVKFAHFLENIVPDGVPGPDRDALLQRYKDAVIDGLFTCQITPELEALRAATPDARWFVVSGGAQDELRDIFDQRGLAAMFDGGIFGNPDDKDTILTREIGAGRMVRPGLFLGDSVFDHQASARAGLDFVFIHGWTEAPHWRDYVAHHDLPAIEWPAILLERA